MSESENKTEPAVTPESTEQTTEAHEAAPPDAANGAEQPAPNSISPPVFSVHHPVDLYTAKSIVAKSQQLAAEWNVFAEMEAEAQKRLVAVRAAYLRIRREMMALQKTCRENELPMTDEMVQMCEQRTDTGAQTAPQPEAQ